MSTDIDLPVTVNLRLSISLNGTEVYGESAPATNKLQANTYTSDDQASPGEIYLIGGELRMRSVDGTTAVTIANG